jgi:Carboxypeptidase regulatory-like domain
MIEQLRWGKFAAAILLFLSALSVARAQVVSGNIAGTVVDKSGAVVANATVTVTNIATGFSKTLTTNQNGEFLFVELPAGNYSVTAAAPGFAKTEIASFPVQLNQTNSVTLTLEVKAATATVEVSGQAPPIDTTTAQVGTTFESVAAVDLPVSTSGAGVLNLSLYNAGVSSSGGVGVGTGPSVAGQRPRDNDFTIEGVDNNSKSVTGPLVYVPNDAVQEFSTLQNLFSPEFGHSNGGQFNTIVKSGTNQIHGLVYSYDQNRNFNAIDQTVIRDGLTKNPRYDNNRWGGDVGGPVVKDKLFYFADFEYNPVGQASIAGSSICTPTAAGYSTLAALPSGPAPNGATVSLNTNNLGILQKYAAASPASTSGTCPYTQGNPSNNALIVCTGGAIPNANGTCPTGTPVPVDAGVLAFSGPNYTNNWALVASTDYNLSDKDQFRIRYIYNRADGIDNSAEFPVFYQPIPNRYQLVAISEYHTFKPNLTSEFRFGFNRYANNIPAGNFSFPGLDSFPNLEFFDTNIQLGPDPNAPQFTIQNLYQFSEGLSWTHGTHNFKFGAGYYWFIAPESFTQRARGDYDYSSLGTYLYDVNPDYLAERSVGLTTYYGNQGNFSWYANDIWRIRPSLSINYGLRYEYTTIPLGEQEQSLNAIANPPTPIQTPHGPLVFSAPRAPKNQFEPRVGVAWSPGGRSDTVIRAGFSLGYDVLFDNLGLLTLPPERIRTVDENQTTSGILTGFLAGGAIPPSTVGATFPNQAAAAASTSAFLPLNLNNPAAVDWTLGVEHSFGQAYTVEIRYLGTHGYYLPVQEQINKQARVSPSAFLPTYLQQPAQATLDALPLTLADLEAQSAYVPAYAAAGFDSANITSYQPIGNSIYHGLAAQFTRRFSHGLQFVGAYTFSHAIDDSTAEVFSTYLTPRRPEDFQDLRADRSNSILDRRHRFTLALVYDMPYFKSGNWLRQNVLGNWLISPIYTYESPEWLDVQSGIDSNLNGDSAGDRVLVNPAGTHGTGSGVSALTNSAGATVAYLVANPSAQYIEAGLGALEPNSGLLAAGRNTLASRPIDNVDVNIAKTFKITERMNIQFNCQAYNLFNHPQFTPGFPDSVFPTGYTSTRSVLEPQSPVFNQDQNYFPSHARFLQLGFKFQF